MTLKAMLGVIECHWRLHHSIDRIGVLVFYCNYGRILYCFRNKTRYSSKNANFHTRLYLTCTYSRLRIFAQNFNANCPSPWAIRLRKNIAEKFKPL